MGQQLFNLCFDSSLSELSSFLFQSHSVHPLMRLSPKLSQRRKKKVLLLVGKQKNHIPFFNCQLYVPLTFTVLKLIFSRKSNYKSSSFCPAAKSLAFSSRRYWGLKKAPSLHVFLKAVKLSGFCWKGVNTTYHKASGLYSNKDQKKSVNLRSRLIFRHHLATFWMSPDPQVGNHCLRERRFRQKLHQHLSTSVRINRQQT